jgi:hypothetical protein
VRSWLQAGNGDGEAAARLLSVYAAAGVKTRASVVPIEQESRIALTTNQAVARRIGLTVPRSIMVRADRVIE